MILSIDTSCDETSAAVTEGTKILSNVIWSQASLHAKFGGVYPSLAQREHEKRIDWVIKKAIQNSKFKIQNLDCIAVTVGPGLAIALEVGIKKAKDLCRKFEKPLIPINHIEGHILSVLAHGNSKLITQNFKLNKIKFPTMAFIASGGTTQLILVKKIGNYQIIAQTIDDALGEALDKGARMLGLGYPGGAILEKIARDGNPNIYSLPVPMIGRENEFKFSYSGIKTALFRLIEKEKSLDAKKIQNLAANYQDRAFKHVENVIIKAIKKYKVEEFWFGGGVSTNLELRKRIRNICKSHNILMRLPYSKKLCTDNAAMIGITANFKFERMQFINPKDLNKVDRVPGAKIDVLFSW